MNAPIPTATASRGQLLVAFAAIYVVWGSTYLGMAIAIETMPPFLMAAVRFAAAGGLLFVVRWLAGDALPTRRQWASAALIGGLLFLGGNGLVCWAQRWVPSGIAALLIATTPFWMTVLPWFAGQAPRPHLRGFAGIGVGLIGVGLLFLAPVGHAPVADIVLGSVLILVASLLWAVGSLCARRQPLPSSLWMSSAAQMLCGSAGLAVVSALHGDLNHVHPEAVSVRSGLALAYLVLIGAIVGFGSYVYLLRHTTMARLSTYAFVNPVVAVVLGWLVLGEPLTSRTLVAGALIVVAVVLIWWPTTARRSGQ